MPIATVMRPVARYGECALSGDAAANRQAAGPSMPATCSSTVRRRQKKACEQELLHQEYLFTAHLQTYVVS